MNDLCETKCNKEDITFDLDESLHAESVLKRRESLVKSLPTLRLAQNSQQDKEIEKAD